MRLPILGFSVDERFLMHRLRSTSIGGLGGAVLVAAMFFYHRSHHVVRWDLFSIVMTATVVKLSVLLLYQAHFPSPR